ncbi:MAG: DUF2085 domain-containing protein [Euryarchaeota archaeon]|nr:DUF2085 domain-containing protein [Euryarchaeota archaeon]
MRLPRITSRVVLALLIFSAVWLALVVLSPLLVPSNTLKDLSGVVGGHENERQFKNLSPLPHAVYWLGDAECHQLASRSLFLNGNQMPFCARDVGLFLGLVVGLFTATFVRWKIPPLLVLMGLVPIAIDGGLQLVTSHESTNPLRLATGLVAGFVLAMLFAHFLFVIKDDKAKPKPVIVEPSKVPEKKISPDSGQ